MQALILTDCTALIAALEQGNDAAAPMRVPTLSSADIDRRDMLALLQKGRSCRAIAAELGVCVRTVKARLMLLYRQTGQHRRMPAPSLR